MSLCLLVHANSKVGKSWLADTAPGPRLILDSEGGTKWTHSRKTPWDPINPVPTVNIDGEPFGPDDSVVVRVLSFKQLELAAQWLVSGQHPFKSVIVDSVTEAQYQCQMAIAGARAMEIQDWGVLLREMLRVCTALKDLPDHPTNPIECVVFTTGSMMKDNTVVPDLQGQLQRKLPYIADVIGYMYSAPDASGKIARGMYVMPVPPFLAGDRTDVLSAFYGPVITAPSIPAMMDVLDGKAPSLG